MADVVRINPGDVLILSGVTLPKDPEPEDFEAFQNVAVFLREQAGIPCVIFTEDDVQLTRDPYGQRFGSLTETVRDRAKLPTDDGRD